MFAVGCAPSEHQYFPLAKGNKWSYSVRNDFDTFVDDIEVVRRVPVGNQEGYELHGKFGTSKFAWNGSVLVASELSGQRFDPPIPILSKAPIEWRGTVEIAGRKAASQAKLESSMTKERFAGRDYDALQTDLVMKSRGQTVRLTTWFVQGMGILLQEQKTGDKRDRRIEYLSGPGT